MSAEVLQHIEDGTWQQLAACRDKDPDIFFPHSTEGVYIAKRICAACVVVEPCLEYALTNRQDHGVYGGASERERRQILRARRRSTLDS
jgi:WhiB family transcriptional regulator, redox-sensing transcriptional regulator